MRALLDEAGIAYEIDPTLVRGLDYYTRTVFELTSDALGAQSGVGGGGRYDGLVAELGGPPTPGMGWAMGVERAMLASNAPADVSPAIDLYIAFEDGGEKAPHRGGQGEGLASQAQPLAATLAGVGAACTTARTAFKVLHEARGAGLAAQMELAGRSLKNQLGHAERLGARYVAIVGGGDERGHRGRRRSRTRRPARRRPLPTATVIHAVLRGLRDL